MWGRVFVYYDPKFDRIWEAGYISGLPYLFRPILNHQQGMTNYIIGLPHTHWIELGAL
jgi:hypothetical protein